MKQNQRNERENNQEKALRPRNGKQLAQSETKIGNKESFSRRTAVAKPQRYAKREEQTADKNYRIPERQRLKKPMNNENEKPVKGKGTEKRHDR